MEIEKENITMEAKKRGRKPLDDKKEIITLFIQASKIKALGGEEALKERLYSTINKTT